MVVFMILPPNLLLPSSCAADRPLMYSVVQQSEGNYVQHFK